MDGNAHRFYEIVKPIESTYDTSSDDVIESLYSPLLKHSVKYVRAAGFFRSSVFRLMTDDLLDFALRGGKMHLITSLHVDKKDYEVAIERIRNEEGSAKEQLLKEILELRKKEEMIPVTDMLAALICCGCLSISIGIRKSGIYHRKKGFFEDEEGRIVLFMGSGNETRTALESVFDEGSAEDFSVYRSWGEDGAWDSHGKKHYQSLIREIDEGPNHKFPIVPIQDLDKEDFLFIEGEDWLDLENHRSHSSERKAKIMEVHEKYRMESANQGTTEVGSSGIKLRRHQEVGLNKWEENGFRGILEHATGSGKTITAITAIMKHLEDGLPVLILVPGQILLGQWAEEIEKFVQSPNILQAGAGNNEWRKNLHFWLDESPNHDLSRVTIAIINTARTKKFLDQAQNLENVLVVVDECHRVGADSFTEICSWKPRKILGLSATPQRFGDNEGTNRVLKMCGEVVHSYGIEEAIRDGYLSRYFYNIERVSLTEKEAEEYDSRMDQIKRLLKMFAEEDGPIDFRKLPKDIQLKIFAAKAIIKKAEKKTAKCADIVSENFVDDGTQNWLIYCQDSSQLGKVRKELEDKGISPIYEYWTGAEGASLEKGVMPFAREETLEIWEASGGILLAIQCLDEGVNIPCISHGIILASSQNSRQFIQRRGRLLRLSENKIHARIWDTLVVPDSEKGGMHTNYVLAEINRAEEFSKNADNAQASWEITNIRHELGLLDNFSSGGISDGSEEENLDD